MQILAKRSLRLLMVGFVCCVSLVANAAYSSHHYAHKKATCSSKKSAHKNTICSCNKHCKKKGCGCHMATHSSRQYAHKNVAHVSHQYAQKKVVHVSHQHTQKKVVPVSHQSTQKNVIHSSHHKVHKNAAYLSHQNAASAKSNLHWIIGAGAGASFLNLPMSTTVANGGPAPYGKDIYTINQPTPAMAQFIVGYRVDREQESIPYFSTFFQYRHTFNTHVGGTIDQYSLPEFLNYNYHVNYDSDSYMLVAKADLFKIKQLMPYVSGGVGVISNHVNSYSEAALTGVTARISPGFGGSTQNSAVYSLGLGVDVIARDNIWVTLGYDHLFLPKLFTNPGLDDWSDSSLNFGNLRADVVFLNVVASIPEKG